MFQAYASLGAGSLGLSDNTVKNIASKVGVTEAQVLLRWSLLPKSAKEERRKTNKRHLGFKLREQDMEELDSLDKN